MKKLIFLTICTLLLSSCAAKPATVNLKATPVPQISAKAPAQTVYAAPIPDVSSAPAATPVPDQTASPSPSETPSPTEAPDSEQPPLLSALCKKQGRDLEEMDCGQLLLVAADGSSCKFYAYERSDNGIWTKVLGTRGHVGKNGVTDNKKEGDKKTPAGIYPLGFAFGHDDDPTGNYSYRSIQSDSYWVDDPDSSRYNQWVDGDEGKDWDSAEALGRIKTEYALALLIEYNYGSDVIPGKGSAIFLHVDDGTTAGCVAIPKEDLKTILKWLDKDKDPHIVISNE